jgi:KUP system potassium uptake protein
MEWLRAPSPAPVVRRRVHFDIPSSDTDGDGRDHSDVRRELTVLSEAKEAGIAYMMSHSCVKAKMSSSLLKRSAIDYAYTFLRKNSRDPALVFNIPHTSLIEVGMLIHLLLSYTTS